MNENFDILEMMAHRKVREKTFLLDEIIDVKQALVWKILYDAAEEKRDTVSKMSRADLNEALVRYLILQSQKICIQSSHSYEVSKYPFMNATFSFRRYYITTKYES